MVGFNKMRFRYIGSAHRFGYKHMKKRYFITTRPHGYIAATKTLFEDTQT